MRSQSYTLQQALTPEATTILKEAINLAKRRNHAQVTPLHVADTMLSAPTGLLRAACLQTHAHPLRCRALVLCFNIALNKLPTITSGPMSGPFSARTHQNPTIANALLAAFKRAQAHQRRGSIENQQQPLLQVKVELEQLIISILDDPSVSRVMREAGFSSILVKGRIEQAITPNNNNTSNNISDNNVSKNRYNNDDNVKINKEFNNSISYNNESDNDSSKSSNNNNVLSMGQLGLVSNYNQEEVKNEDVVRVIESLVMNKRKRNAVIVGECMASLECLVKEVINRVEKGGVHEVLKDVKFVQLSFSSFGHLSREEVEQRIGEIKCVVKSCCLDNNKGLIIYFDDFNWGNEFRASNNNILVDQYQPIRRNYYCPIEHMIMEIGKLVLSFGEKKLWILGIATFETYMKCQSGNPSLETLWGLHAITIPLDSLALSLISNSSEKQSPLTKKKSEVNGNGWLMLDGSRGGGGINDTESQQNPCRTTLPPWLQHYKDENIKRMCNMNNNDQDYMQVKDHLKRWSTMSTSCMDISPTQTSPPSFERTLSLSSISPSSSTSNYSCDPMNLQHTYHSFEPTLTMSIKDGENNDHPNLRHTNMFISSNPNSTPTSTSSSDVNEPTIDQSNYAIKRFNEYNDDNLRTICNVLEQKVPRQKDIVFDIASTILNCRCGSPRRNVDNNEKGVVKEDTWLFFQGYDVKSKESIAKELARLIFGSQDKFVSIGLSNFSSTRDSYSLEDFRTKRLRDEDDCIYIERFFEAVSQDPHRVFFVEDIDQVDYSSQMLIKKAIERGKIDNNEVVTCSLHSSAKIPTSVCFEDAIIILSCEKFRSKSRVCSPSTKLPGHVLCEENNQIIMNKGENKEIGSPNISLDLNLSINDEEIDVVNSRSIDEIGFLAMVDKCVVFKNRQLSFDN